MKALTVLFYMLSLELPFFFQDEGHTTLAPQIVCKVILSQSIDIHQFLQYLDARNLFDGEMLRFVVRDQNDKQFGSFRFFCSSMRFTLQI